MFTLVTSHGLYCGNFMPEEQLHEAQLPISSCRRRLHNAKETPTTADWQRVLSFVFRLAAARSKNKRCHKQESKGDEGRQVHAPVVRPAAGHSGGSSCTPKWNSYVAKNMTEQ